MPNPRKLYQLIELREAAGLTLAEMATCCGLTGSQSRKTVASWEVGESTPRRKNALNFATYLLQNLNLAEDRVRFDALWETLSEEWGWEPLSEEDIEYCSTEQKVIKEATDSTSKLLGNIEIVEDADTIKGDLESAKSLAEGNETTTIGGTKSEAKLVTEIPDTKRWLGLLLALVLMSILVMVGSAFWWQQNFLQSFVLPTASEPLKDANEQGNAPLPIIDDSIASDETKKESERDAGDKQSGENRYNVINPGFEDETTEPWTWHGQCPHEIRQDTARAFEGERYLSFGRPDVECRSLYQDIQFAPQKGETIRLAMHLRAEHKQNGQAVMMIRAFGGASEPEEHSIRFQTQASRWTCYETELTIAESGRQLFAITLFPETMPEEFLHVDGVQIALNGEPLCLDEPTHDITFASTRIVPLVGDYHAGSTIAAETRLINETDFDIEEGREILFWISAVENERPINPGFIATRKLPAIAAGETSPPIYADVPIPIKLSPTNDYFVVFATDLLITTSSDRIALESRPFRIQPCTGESIYCDVPTGHWAKTEIEAWYHQGISRRCRSFTEPYLDLPFCPEELVRRETFPVFVIRHIEGSQYRQSGNFEEIFDDVPITLHEEWAIWIEDFYRMGYRIPKFNCSSADGKRYCPMNPVLRGEAALFFADLFDWPIEMAEPSYFQDDFETEQMSQAAHYMYQQDYIAFDDPTCLSSADAPRFCPDEPLRRATAAVFMARAFGLVEPPTD